MVRQTLTDKPKLAGTDPVLFPASRMIFSMTFPGTELRLTGLESPESSFQPFLSRLGSCSRLGPPQLPQLQENDGEGRHEHFPQCLWGNPIHSQKLVGIQVLQQLPDHFPLDWGLHSAPHPCFPAQIPGK